MTLTMEDVYRRLFEKHGESISIYNYISQNDYADFVCNVCGHNWSAICSSVTTVGCGCPNCARFEISKSLTTPEDVARQKLFEVHGNTISMASYLSMKKKADFLCNVCGRRWSTAPENIITSKKGCRRCKNKKHGKDKTISLEEIKNRVNKNHSGKIEVIIYTKTQAYGKFKCLVCDHVWEVNDSFAVIDGKTGCPNCSKKAQSGENSRFWKGGMTPLTKFIRSINQDWNIRSAENSNYRCVVTGRPMDVIHHLTGFNILLSLTMKKAEIDLRKSVSDYSSEELNKIILIFKETQDEFGLGVALCSDVHLLFHKLYGKGKNTPQQFGEFLEKIKSKEIEIS